jgi:hypothetical protein
LSHGLGNRNGPWFSDSLAFDAKVTVMVENVALSRRNFIRPSIRSISPVTAAFFFGSKAELAHRRIGDAADVDLRRHRLGHHPGDAGH